MPRPALTCPHCGKRQSGKQGLAAHIATMHPAPAAPASKEVGHA